MSPISLTPSSVIGDESTCPSRIPLCLSRPVNARPTHSQQTGPGRRREQANATFLNILLPLSASISQHIPTFKLSLPTIIMRTSILALTSHRRTALALPFPKLLVFVLVFMLDLTTPSVCASGSAPWGASSVRTVPVVGSGKWPWVGWVGRGRDHIHFAFITPILCMQAK